MQFSPEEGIQMRSCPTINKQPAHTIKMTFIDHHPGIIEKADTTGFPTTNGCNKSLVKHLNSVRKNCIF